MTYHDCSVSVETGTALRVVMSTPQITTNVYFYDALAACVAVEAYTNKCHDRWISRFVLDTKQTNCCPYGIHTSPEHSTGCLSKHAWLWVVNTLSLFFLSFFLLLIQPMFICLVMCTLHQDNSAWPLSRELYTLHAVRPKHMDIALFLYTAPSVCSSLPREIRRSQSTI